jgi:modulator of FtsH protease HflK
MAVAPHPQDDPRPPETPVDAGSQALSEALRSSFSIVKFVMLLLIGLFLASGLFTVGPQERAIIIRLGKPVGEGEKALLGPGLHYSWPYPIDEYVKVPITAIQRVRSSVGWFAVTPAQEVSGEDRNPLPVTTPMDPEVDGYVLTADNNIIHSRATLTYHIADPVGFIFNFVNASNAVLSALDESLIYAAAQFKVDDILTRDVAGFKEVVRKRTAELVERQNLGIVVEDCQLESRAPRQLKDAFDNVLKAEVTRNKVLDEAHIYENRTINRASADAQSRINSAESERARLVNDISSQADRFNDVLPKYRANPNLFVQQRLAETLSRVLTNVQDKIFLAEGPDGNQKELRLLLNREAPKNKPEESKP